MSETIKPASSNETHDEVTPVKNASVENETKYDLKHLSPLIIEENYEQNILTNQHISKKINESFQADKCTIDEIVMQDIFSDYYKTNENNHFVWTNQNVIRDARKINTELPRIFYTDVINHEHCDLSNPDKSFELRKHIFGFGLYAKHLIPKGSFSVKFVIYIKTS